MYSLFSFVYRDQVVKQGDLTKVVKGFQTIPCQKYKACPNSSGLGYPEERCSAHSQVSKMWLVEDKKVAERKPCWQFR